ncbi:hypothetical protein DB42_EE00030 [Neochlamydia sp. EPS4]|nr:hypothetical protein DB42_EE00030 [Neochlamydia sp. EPS4]
MRILTRAKKINCLGQLLLTRVKPFSSKNLLVEKLVKIDAPILDKEE